MEKKFLTICVAQVFNKYTLITTQAGIAGNPNKMLHSWLKPLLQARQKSLMLVEYDYKKYDYKNSQRRLILPLLEKKFDQILHCGNTINIHGAFGNFFQPFITGFRHEEGRKSQPVGFPQAHFHLTDSPYLPGKSYFTADSGCWIHHLFKQAGEKGNDHSQVQGSSIRIPPAIFKKIS